MKNPMGFIVTVLIICIPIVWCCVSLVNTNKEYKDNIDKMQSITNDINEVIDSNISSVGSSSSENTYQGNSSDEPSKDGIGEPIGKLVEGATINVSVANVYTNPDETSAIMGSVTKNTVVTAHDYPKGWTRIKCDDLSGWVRTEYITKPSDIGSTGIGSVIGRTGVVTAESLNVRQEPINGKVITTLTKDTDVKILAVDESNKWYKVQGRTTWGWVSAEYIEVQY